MFSFSVKNACSFNADEFNFVSISFDFSNKLLQSSLFPYFQLFLKLLKQEWRRSNFFPSINLSKQTLEKHSGILLIPESPTDTDFKHAVAHWVMRSYHIVVAHQAAVGMVHFQKYTY